MHQLKPQDAQFLYMEDGQVAAHVTSVGICDQATAPNKTVRFKEILKTVEERLGDSPIFNRKLKRLPFDMDFPYWVDDPHFDLEYHVRHGRLPAPADWRQFCIHVARFHSRPLDMSRPPWEIYVIEGLNNVEGVPKGSFGLVTKMHHSAVDGTSAQKFLFSMMDLGPKGPPVIPPSGKRPAPVASPSMPEMLTRAAVNNVSSPVTLARKALGMAPSLAREAIRSRRQKDRQMTIPQTRFNRDVSPNRAFDAVSFPLEDFRNVARAFDDAKINDVVLAVCSGALRSYLSEKNELPEEPLVATAPINMRPKDAAGADDGNNISAMAVPLFTNIANPVDRLKSIVRATQAAKQSKSGSFTRLFTDLSQHVPAPALALVGTLIANDTPLGERMSNVFISNVPGIQFPLYFCGAEVLETWGMAPIGAGVGLFIATPSYNGKLGFSLTTTRQMMPDTPVFIGYLKDALEELKVAAEKKAGATARASANGSGKKKRARKTYHRVRPAAGSDRAKANGEANGATKKTTKAKRASKPAAKRATKSSKGTNGAAKSSD